MKKISVSCELNLVRHSAQQVIMSLVAYGSSDEGSDVEDSAPGNSSGLHSEQKGISATSEEADDINVERSGSGLKLPAPKFSGISSSRNTRQDAKTPFARPPEGPERDASVATKLAGAGVCDADDNPDEEILEIEEYVPLRRDTKSIKAAEAKPKSVGGMFSLLPPPWKSSFSDNKEATGKAKNLVKIAAPSAPKADSDEEMDAEPAIKRPRPSQGGSGLASLLPKPKHSVTVKSDNPNKPSMRLANRPLIPHTLTKKAPTKEDAKTAKKKTSDDDEHGSDEDEPVSFFTFQDKTSETAKEASIMVEPADHKQIENMTSAAASASHEVLRPAHVVQSAPEPTPSPRVSTPEHRTKPKNVMSQATPQVLQGPGSSLDAQTYYYGQQGVQESQYGMPSSGHYMSYPTYAQSSSSVTTSYYSPEEYTQSSAGATAEATAPPQDAIDVQQLKRLQGRKNRGEQINIVDVNAADQMSDPSLIAIRQRSEELAPRPSMKKGDMPSSQQRRKHQITYLAFQAKEREHELRQQWAANSQTRRQTQSKYGF